MSRVCEVAEWGFAHILAQYFFEISELPCCQILNFQSLACQYLNLLYGNQTMEYFICEPFSLDQYLALIDKYFSNQIHITIDKSLLIID